MRAMSLAAFSLFFMTQSFAAQLIQCEPGQNFLAKNIYGLWEYDAVLSEWVGDKDNDLLRMRLFPDETVLSHFAPVNEFLVEDTCVYAAGYLDIFLSEDFTLARPFILIALDGAPAVYWLESYGDKDFEAVTFRVSFAAGSDDSLDRLIVGGAVDAGRQAKFLKRGYLQ